MTYSVSIASIEKSNVHDAVGEAVAKQVGFHGARCVACAIERAAYAIPGTHVSIIANGYGVAAGSKSGSFSLSMSFTTPEPAIVEPVQDSAQAS